VTLSEQIIQFEQAIRERPYLTARLWHKPAPRTSQLRAIQRAGSAGTLILGGNRTGKSEAGAMLACAVAIGRSDPDVQRWLIRHRIPLELVPARPGRVWAIALDSNDSREYLRPKYAKYLPPDTKWRNRDGVGIAEARTPTGGVVVFKSADAGRDSFQGDSIDLAHFDEEPADSAVFRETLMRLIDRRGRWIMTMTPLRGQTWVYRDLVAQPPPGVAVHWLHGTDNPHIPQDILAAMLRQFGAHEQAARLRGEFTALEGRVYQDWRSDLHITPRRTLPADWRRFRSIDFGTRNPFACLWAALDPADDTLHIYAEHYQAEWTLSQHAARIKRLSEGQRIKATIADPEDRGARLALAREHGIRTLPASKSIRVGINAVAERLRCNAEGRPGLLVHSNCTNLIREIQGYVWDQRSTKQDQPDKPLKRDDHTLDALRYLCLWLQRSLKSGVS
jgi:phage terminase large subunit-like protein